MPASNPLVSIICLCYNQAPFVQEALESVWAQTYPEVELIVVDDGSADGSPEFIRSLLVNRSEVQFIDIPETIGNCKAFNRAFKLCRGKYVIDLAADDVLIPERVAEGVKALEEAGADYGVHFTDAVFINIEGKELRRHYKRNKDGSLAEKVPQGWVYQEVVERYFICTPTMMMRRSVLDALGGYDESLTYEDFDFWLRSSRHWKYHFSDQVLVKKRVVPGSLSSRQYEKESKQLESTLKICRKAKGLNESPEEERALAIRLAYEIRQAIRTGNFETGNKMLALKEQQRSQLLEDSIYRFLLRYRIKLPGL